MFRQQVIVSGIDIDNTKSAAQHRTMFKKIQKYLENTKSCYSQDPPEDWTRRDWQILSLLFLLAVWFRFEVILIFGGQEQSYQAWSDKFYFGGIAYINIQGANLISNFDKWVALGYLPGYPFFLAILKWLGLESPELWRFPQAIFSSLAIFPVFYISKFLRASSFVAYIGVLLYALSPFLAFGATVVMAEALTVPLFLWIMALSIYTFQNQKLWSGIILGLVTGYCGTLRSDLILLMPFTLLLGWTLQERKQQILKIYAVVASAALIPIIISCTYRYLSIGQWTPNGQGGSYALVSGLGQFENPYGYYVSDKRAAQETENLGITWYSKEFDHYMRTKYKKALVEHPEHIFKSVVWRWMQMASTQHVIEGYNALKDFKLVYFLFKPWAIATVLFALSVLYYTHRQAVFLFLFPTLYAYLTLGLVYWESRYVRYISLTFLFAWIVVLQLTLAYWISIIEKKYKIGPQKIKRSIAFLLAIYFSVSLFKNISLRTSEKLEKIWKIDG